MLDCLEADGDAGRCLTPERLKELRGETPLAFKGRFPEAMPSTTPDLESLAPFAPAFQSLLAENAILFERYERFIDYAGYADAFAPNSLPLERAEPMLRDVLGSLHVLQVWRIVQQTQGEMMRRSVKESPRSRANVAWRGTYWPGRAICGLRCTP